MSRPAALLALHVAVALFGFAGLFAKWLTLEPVAIVLGRTVIAAAALAALAAVSRERLAPSRALAANGAILALHWVSFFAAIRVSSVAIGLLGYASFPLFVLALEHRAGKPWAAREAVVAALVTVGLASLVPSFSWQDGTVRGLAWGLLSGFTFAWLAVRSRAMVAAQPATSIALWQNAFAAVALVPVALATGALVRAPTAGELAGLAVLGVLCTALAHTLFIASMRRVSAHVASVVAALEPVYGIALAAVLLAERPGWRTLAGGTMIVAAALLATRAPRRRPGDGDAGRRGVW